MKSWFILQLRLIPRSPICSHVEGPKRLESISPNFVPQAKSCRLTALDEKFAFQFYHHSVLMKFAPICMYGEICFTFAKFHLLKKSCENMLVKSTPGVNFTIILCTALALIDSKSVKITVSHHCPFMHFGSTRIKAVHRMLMKLTPINL